MLNVPPGGSRTAARASTPPSTGLRRFWVRNTHAFSCARPTNSTPLPAGEVRQVPVRDDALVLPFPKDTRSTPGPRQSNGCSPRTYPLSQAPEAIRYLQQGHARGKIVITV